VHRVAECPGAAGKHKLVANKFGKAPTARSARAATLFASPRPDAQLSNAWTQKSYPALWSAMPGALRDCCLVGRNLTSPNSRGRGISTLDGEIPSACRGLPALPAAIW